MKKSLVELAKAVKEDIKLQERYIESFSKNENPQVKEMYLEAVARKEALEAVLLYTQNGSKILFHKHED